MAEVEYWGEEDLRMQESILKLDDGEFGDTTDEFPNFARETMQRYKESNNLDLYKLILRMKMTDDDCASLATELIIDALNLSAKKLHIEIAYTGKTFVLVDKVFFCGSWQELRSNKGKVLVLPGQVFESRSLKELSATYCIINQPISGSVTCSALVSLNLTSVTIGDEMMRDILSKCPLIEYLNLYECKGLRKISLGNIQHNLKHCSVEYIEGGCFVDFFEQGFTQYRNLSSLEFNYLHLEKTFFRDSMVKFPCLMELSLRNIYGFEEMVEISSPSLKCLSVEWLSETRWVFNVPNIRKFKCWGYTNIPPLYISTSSNEWESADIELDCCEDLPRSWFLGLREFLQNLSVSKKISLRLVFDYTSRQCPSIDQLLIEDVSGVVPCIPVENLVFEDLLAWNSLSLSAFSNLVSGLFSTCRPNLITLIESRGYPPLQSSGRDLPVLELLCKSVTEQANWKCDLKQVTFEMLFKVDETLKEWRPILWDDLVSSISLKIHGMQIRLKLEWHGMED